MKDRKAILILAVLLAILFQMSKEISIFKNYWSIVNPLIIAITCCILLSVIQRKNQNTFINHFIKSLKIGFLTLVIYLPICFLVSARWVDNFHNSYVTLIGKIPMILASSITTGMMLFGTLIVSVVLSYIIGTKKVRT